MDFGHALVKMNGVLRKVAFFVMALPYSDAVFVQAFERECTETFWEGHVQAFGFFGGVPRRITYDNSKVAVAQILGGGKERRLTHGFLQLKSHYFDGGNCNGWMIARTRSTAKFACSAMSNPGRFLGDRKT